MLQQETQLNSLAGRAPFLRAGFDPRHIRQHLPAPGRRVTAPAPAGAAGLLASGLGRVPCLRACALRQSEREGASPERFQAVLWRRRLCGNSGPSSLSSSSLPQKEQKLIQRDERVPLSPVFSRTGPGAGVFTQPRRRASGHFRALSGTCVGSSSMEPSCGNPSRRAPACTP